MIEATDRERQKLRQRRVGKFATDPAKFFNGKTLGAIGESLYLARDECGMHVVTKAGYILCTNNTRWRAGAIAVTLDEAPSDHRITLHTDLAMTAYYCPASGTLLAIDVHERGRPMVDDVVLDLESVERLFLPQDTK